MVKSRLQDVIKKNWAFERTWAIYGDNGVPLLTKGFFTSKLKISRQTKKSLLHLTVYQLP